MPHTAWINGTLATMNPEIDDEYGLLIDHALITAEDKIVAIRPQEGLTVSEFDEIIDLREALVTPGFIDCHTHLVFGGDRAGEWEMRLNGVSYADIAAEGGGIRSTVLATRGADAEELYQKALPRLEAMKAEGVTCLEIKSGYGLNLDSERRCLEVARALKDRDRVDVSPTLLAAHSVPPEYADRPEAYVDEICARILPTLWNEGLFEAVDVFVESLAFSVEQAEKIFMAADALGIPVKAHSEQMSNIGSSLLVARHNGWSTDHIEHLDETAIQKMSEKRTVATLLPTAYYFLRDTNKPPVELLRKYKVPMAVSTDYNPGTSPFTSIRQAMNMACTLFGLTPLEAMLGVTRNAAQALGRESTHGQLSPGYRADFAIWNVNRPVEIFYEVGYNPLLLRVFGGIMD